MSLIPLEIPPGFVKVDSPNAAKGRFTGGNFVRWVNKLPEKWLGWRRFIDDLLLGVARGALSWTNAFGNTNVAIGTHLKLYVITGGDTLRDITPIRSSSTINNNPFTTTNGSKFVTVTDTAHGAEADAFVTFSGASAVGGITVSGEYQIVDKLDPNSYTIEHSVAATSGATGGGASVTAAYQTNPGSTGTVGGLGWGAGPYGEGTWGTERAEGLPIEIRHWSLAEYGNDLLASPSGDTLFLWQEATDTRAEAVANAPAEIRAMFVTGERFIFCLGTVTPMTVQWPDRDDMTDFVPGTGDTANQRVLQVGSKLVAGTAVADGINLVWSDTAVYLFQYVTTALIYDSRLLATNCGLIGPLAFKVVSGQVFWRSGRTFYMYSGGGVQRVPRQEDIEDFVNLDMEPGQAEKTWAEYDEPNRQVRWHYCHRGSVEPDRYVDVSIDDFSWTTGDWSQVDATRTSGCKYQPTAETGIMIDADGQVWEHNAGYDAGDEPMPFSLTWGLYALTRGESNVDIFGLVPDCQRQTGNVTYEVFTKDRPNSASNMDEQTVVMGPTDEIADLRVCGRHFSMTATMNELGADVRFGIVNLDPNPSGERR
jgi:hypothetical protein